jgi:hypothetical protein
MYDVLRRSYRDITQNVNFKIWSRWKTIWSNVIHN